MTPRDPELVELVALRSELAASLAVSRSLMAQMARIVMSRLGSGRVVDQAEIRRCITVLAHALRLDVPDAAPVAVLGRASTGGDVLVLVADGSALVRRLRPGVIEDLMAAPATVDEARWWVAGLDGLAADAETIGIEDVAALVAAIRGGHGR